MHILRSITPLSEPDVNINSALPKFYEWCYYLPAQSCSTVNQLNSPSLAGQTTKTMKTRLPALPVDFLPIIYCALEQALPPSTSGRSPCSLMVSVPLPSETRRPMACTVGCSPGLPVCSDRDSSPPCLHQVSWFVMFENLSCFQDPTNPSADRFQYQARERRVW